MSDGLPGDETVPVAGGPSSTVVLENTPKATHWCSFCSKSNNEVKLIITGEAGACICDECIELCRDIIGSARRNRAEEVALRPEPPATASDDPVREDERTTVNQVANTVMIPVEEYEALKQQRDDLLALVPQRTAGGFVAFGKYYAEQERVFAPPHDPMAKFKHKYLDQCEAAIAKVKG